MEADYDRRFSGLDRLWGAGSSQLLAQAHVAIVGLGGVGSWCAEALARSGVGALTLIDFDQVAESNINRQVHALTQTVGQAKIDAMRDRIMGINPECQVHLVEDFLTPDNIDSTWPEQAQVVVDACDQGAAKLAMAMRSLQQSLPLVMVGAAGGKSQPQAVRVGDLSQVTHDPLLARLRRELRRTLARTPQQALGIACVYSQEPVRASQLCDVNDKTTHDLNCHGYGSFVGVTATFGLVAASCAIEHIIRGKTTINKL
jgi:tRNA A37 threonylcarbamoyladenosine dehydratase